MSRHDNFGDTNDEATGREVPISPGPGQNTYHFSNDEIRVLKECNRESFFQRSLPFGTVLGAAAYYGVKTGYLRPNRRWGATPKVIVASVIGYFFGKFSYQTKCAEKLMQLPDSRLGAMLRARKRGTFKESLDPGYGPGMSLSPFSNVNPSDTYTDVGPNTEIDTSRPEQNGLDDSQRPSLDSNPNFEEDSMPPRQEQVTTFDELRKKNRDEFYNQRGTIDVPERQPVRKSPTQPSPRIEEETRTRPKRTNIYGDNVE